MDKEFHQIIENLHSPSGTKQLRGWDAVKTIRKMFITVNRFHKSYNGPNKNKFVFKKRHWCWRSTLFMKKCNEQIVQND